MKKECVEQPITFPVPVFRRLSAFQQSKKISLEGIVLPVLEKLLPKTEDAGEATFPEGFFVQSPEGSGESVRRLIEIPFPLMARLVEYRKTRQLSLEDIIVPILDKGLPKLPPDGEREIPVSLFPTEFSHIDKSSAGVLLGRQFSCPFDKTVFTAPCLKSKALNSRLDDFFMTEYTDAIGGRPYVDYSFFEVKVCPACLYANFDRGFRLYDSINNVWQDPRGLVVNDASAEALRGSVGRRSRVAAQAGMEGHRLFSARRSCEDALVAAALGIDALSALLTGAKESEKARLFYTQGLLHIQQSRFYQKLEGSGSDAASCRTRRVASLRDAMDAFALVEGTMLQDKYFQEAHEVLLYYYRKMVVAELLGDKDTFESAKTVIRKLYGDYCLGRGKGTPAEKKAATLFFNAIDEGARKFDPERVLV